MNQAMDASQVSVSTPGKLMFPKAGLTKQDLVDYYRKIAAVMLPHIENRPINMHRFPDGIDSDGFYEKEIPEYFPDWIDRVEIEVKEQDRVQQQVVCNKAATLAYLGNQACITPHIWLSRVDRIHYPDRIIFDLDPPGDDFKLVKSAAWMLKSKLEEIGLASFVMTTGSRGLHVIVPIDQSVDFDTSRTFAREICQELVKREPERLTIEMQKNQRARRLFLDYLRNSYAQTTVAPYALRPNPSAPVATPLDWDELNDPNLTSQSYTIKNIFRRLGQKTDPWKNISQQARSLEDSRALL